MAPVHRWTIATGVALVCAAAVVLLWPLHATGVTGNALQPRYHDFGGMYFVPVSTHPSFDQLRQLGVTLPEDVVASRIRTAIALTATGLIAVAIALVAAWRRRSR